MFRGVLHANNPLTRLQAVCEIKKPWVTSLMLYLDMSLKGYATESFI